MNAQALLRCGHSVEVPTWFPFMDEDQLWCQECLGFEWPAQPPDGEPS